jgi:hypothetical protein
MHFSSFHLIPVAIYLQSLPSLENNVIFGEENEFDNSLQLGIILLDHSHPVGQVI